MTDDPQGGQWQRRYEGSLGLMCASTEGPWETASDVAPALGGGGTAPSPSALVRAALGSCMAMSYRLRAARHGVELGSIRVTVESDSDLAGMLVDDATARPGFAALRYHVEIDSAAPCEDVERVVAEGDRLSPVLDALRNGAPVQRTLSIGSRPG